MKSSGSLEDIQAGTKVKMICVSKDDFCLDIILEVSMIYALYRTYCAYRHEDRCLDLTMVSGDDTAAGR
jgi:hypothetical protein